MPRDQPPSLQEVADQAGVSRMTASRALRNAPRCSEQTKARVQKVAAEIGYRPNPLIVARMQMMRQKHPQSGVCLAIAYLGESPDGWKRIWNDRHWVDGIRTRADQLGFMTEIVHFPLLLSGSVATIRTLTHRNVDGLCFLPFPESTWQLELKLDQFACASIGYTLTTPMLHRVATDHREAIVMVVDKLRQTGYRRIGLVVERHTSSRIGHRHLEYFLAQRELATSDDLLEPLIVSGDLHSRENERAFTKWYKPNRPEVIISNLDALPFIASTGLRIPETIGFVSLDIQGDSNDLSGIDQDAYRVGACVADRVASQIYCNARGIPTHPELTLVPPAWRDGKTIRQMP